MVIRRFVGHQGQLKPHQINPAKLLSPTGASSKHARATAAVGLLQAWHGHRHLRWGISLGKEEEVWKAKCKAPVKAKCSTAQLLIVVSSLPKSELSLLSKKSLDPTLWTIMSQEYTERVQLISVARMASVANTFP